METWKESRCRRCPMCGRVIEKLSGCDLMLCGTCIRGSPRAGASLNIELVSHCYEEALYDARVRLCFYRSGVRSLHWIKKRRKVFGEERSTVHPTAIDAVRRGAPLFWGRGGRSAGSSCSTTMSRNTWYKKDCLYINSYSIQTILVGGVHGVGCQVSPHNKSVGKAKMPGDSAFTPP